MNRSEAKWRGENRIKRFLSDFPPPMDDALTPDLYDGDGQHVQVKMSPEAFIAIEWTGLDDSIHKVSYSSVGAVMEWETTPPCAE